MNEICTLKPYLFGRLGIKLHRKNQETKAFRCRNVDLPIRKGINSLSRDAGLCSPVLQGSSPGAAMPAGRSSDEVSQKSARFCWDISPDVFVAKKETS